MLDYDQLREAPFKPRVHPNGFIQLNLNEAGTKRLHIWPEDGSIERQKTNHPIHDHNFNMHSKILCGQLMQIRIHPELEFDMYQGPSHQIYMANYSSPHESTLDPTGIYVDCPSRGSSIHSTGDFYVQPAGSFHESIPMGFVATVMTKVDLYEIHQPRILVPVGVDPDNEFVRAADDQELLWKHIKRACEEQA